MRGCLRVSTAMTWSSPAIVHRDVTECVTRSARGAQTACLERRPCGLAQTEARARIGERLLPQRVRPGVAVSQLRVDREHRRVVVGVPGADEPCGRSLAEDPL